MVLATHNISLFKSIRPTHNNSSAALSPTKPRDMASCSSSAAILSKKYHVFISFRGEDTRHNFVSHLHDALCRNNIETYIDYRLENGEKVWTSLEEAIHDSMMFLIVFSENYATSTWCLKELTTILECSKEDGLCVIPVFYKIDPSHIRKQKGSYKTAFRNHEKSNPKEQVQKWRDALTHATNLSGWHSSTYRNEAELIQKIVKQVLKKLDREYQDICLEGLVGVKEKVEDVELLMQNSSRNVRFIGIWGMAGIGKTTIAKALFNKLCFSFDSFCFLANVREEYERFGIEHIKYKLLSTLLEDEKSYKGMPDGGSTYVGMRLRKKKVLVVLDDIDNSKQLESLAGAHNWFGKGSRIIITTRDKKVLGPNVDDVYKVKLLMSHQALQLFKMKAFKDYNCCDEEFQCLSLKVVDYANGLPLALIVLGGFLYGEDKSVWESQLEKLRKTPPKDIQSILRLSYNILDHEEKEIFLFVACYFKTCSVEHIKNLLDACALSTTVGLRSLHDKELLTICDGDVSMHDLIKEMGMETVREESWDDPGKRSRLWDAKDICQILKDDKGSKAIKSITLDMSKAEDLSLSPQAFSKMPNLLFLDIYNYSFSKKHRVHLPQGLGYLPNELRYLCWDNFPSKSLPSSFAAVNLVELNMTDNGMTKLWHGVLNVVNLKKIELYDCKHLKMLPDLSKAKNLETVTLYGCARIGEVHPSILSENKLRELTLTNCVALKILKSDTELRSISKISLAGCPSLKEFSIMAENMRDLGIIGTAIKEVPSCIGHMPKLERLNLSKNKSMRYMVRNLFDGLHSLKLLNLEGLYNILEAVNDVKRLVSPLYRLQLDGSSVESLCEMNLLFPELYDLVIKSFSRLRCLPPQLPPSLKHLQVSCCASLLSLPPQLPSTLEHLHVSDCASLLSLPQLPPSLKTLRVVDCPHLRHVTQFHPSLFVSNSSSQQTVHVTSTIGELYKAIFENCFQLDEHLVKAILANAILQPQREPHRDFELRYPGSSVLEWFKYKTTHPSLLVDLSSAPLSSNWSLLCCIIAAPPSPSMGFIMVRCRYRIPIFNDELAKWETNSHFEVVNMTSNHAIMWLDESISPRMHEIMKSRANSNSKILLQLEIECFGTDFTMTKLPIEIKEYGVCPTYDSECQNFLNEMGLVSQAKTSRVGARCSSNNQDDQNDNSSIYFSFEDSDEDTSISSTFQPCKKPRWS